MRDRRAFMSHKLQNIIVLGFIVLLASGCAGMASETARPSSCGPYGDPAKCG